MVIFMPYYRQHGQILHSHARNRPLTSSSTVGQESTTTGTAGALPSMHISACKFASSILCRWSFSLFLFAIAVFLFQLSSNNHSENKKEGSNIVAAILLIVAIVSFLRTCQTLRAYLTMMHTRRRLIQRLGERRLQAYNLALNLNTDTATSEYVFFRSLTNQSQEKIVIIGDANDLPTYKELFPSHPDLSNTSATNASTTSSPPSYDDFVKNLFSRQRIPRVMIPTDRLSVFPSSNLNSTSQPTSTNRVRQFWLLDTNRSPTLIRDTVSYV